MKEVLCEDFGATPSDRRTAYSARRVGETPQIWSARLRNIDYSIESVHKRFLLTSCIASKNEPVSAANERVFFYP